MDFNSENLWKAIADREMVEIELQKSIRRMPSPGDIFATKVAGCGWVPIQVMQVDPALGADKDLTFGENQCFLIYIYNTVCETLKFDTSKISHRNLLAPPIVLSRELWTCKYFVFVESKDLDEESFIPQHCFWDFGRHVFHDNFGRILDGMTWPCASSAVTLRNGLAKILHKSLRAGFDQYSNPFE